MHFENQYTYAKPFDGRKNLTSQQTAFFLRTLKKRFDEWMQEESSDEFFQKILDASLSSNGSGPLPFGPMFGLPLPFIRLYEGTGICHGYSEVKGRKASDFFFGKTAKLAETFPTIILHIPHSGTKFPTSLERFDNIFLEKAKDVIDYYTDELFIPDQAPSSIIPVSFEWCRTFCDVERMIDDPLEKKNLGISYDSNFMDDTHGFFQIGEKMYGVLNRDTAERLYVGHHQKVENALLEHPGSLVIDCHSFSSGPTPLLPDASKAAAYDICIGFNEDRTRPSDHVIHIIMDHFLSQGYKVGINTPFSNAKTFSTPSSYKAVMIEVNKRLYMDESTLEKKPEFEKLRTEISSLYGKLIGKSEDSMM